MQKRPVRLGRSALRKLINEAIVARRPGTSFFTEERQGMSPRTTFERAYSEASKAIRDYYMSLYDEHDPVMSEYGKEAWEAQVSYAMHQIDGELSSLIERIQDDLENGEFGHAAQRTGFLDPH